jgi:hypothetical protein
MQEVTVTLYTAKELKEIAPDTGFIRALTKWGNAQAECYDAHDISDSYRAVAQIYGIEGRGYRCHTVPDEVFELPTLGRRMAWVENNAKAPLRMPWGNVKVGTRRGIQHSRKYTRPGIVPDCPLTGVCYDNDLMACAEEHFLRGCTRRQIDRALDDRRQQLCDSELEYLASEENFLESDYDTLYTIKGEIFYA